MINLAEGLNKSPTAVACVVGVLIAIAGISIWHSIKPSQAANTGTASAQLFYSVDDGKTYFADDISKGVSFERNGQLAVQAFVFSCVGGSKFVGYLERIRPQVQQKINALPKANYPGIQSEIGQLEESGREVKRPGVGNWVQYRSPQGMEIQQVKCPGGNGNPVLVQP